MPDKYTHAKSQPSESFLKTHKKPCQPLFIRADLFVVRNYLCQKVCFQVVFSLFLQSVSVRCIHNSASDSASDRPLFSRKNY